MLLFSTVLPINNIMTKELFIKLVIEWNQGSPHRENIIPAIKWNGERNIRYGDDTKWMEIEEYRNQNIIAVRYEKIEDDGIVWDTDYVMNFNDMKMSIRLDRSYKNEAQLADADFSTPYFITLLIDKGYLEKDGELPILNEPVYIDESNLTILTDVINKNVRYHIPVVYVSKTVFNYDPVNVKALSNRLKGVAHVLVQADHSSNSNCRKICNEKNEYNGGIGIYFPNTKHRRYLYKRYTGTGMDQVLLNKIVRTVIQYFIVQNMDSLYTWQGVNNSILRDRFISQREERLAAERTAQKTEDETNKLLDAFEEDMRKLQRQVEELTRKNESLTYENQGLRTKLSENENTPVLITGDENDFYPGEIKEIVLSVLYDAVGSAEQKSRKRDVLCDIIDNNKFEHKVEKREREVKKLLKGYKRVNAPMKQALMNLGFEITEEGKHYKLTYFGDRRYWTTIAKTPSDGHTGTNVARTICREMFGA